VTIPIATVSRICDGCGAQVAPALLACPACDSLVFSARLQELANTARTSAERGDFTGALAAWREAIELLPPDSRQHQVVSEKIDELSRRVLQGGGSAQAAAPQHSNAAKKAAAGLGALGLLLWKLKVVLLFALTKGKLLLLGLTKASTLLSMLVSLGAYWAAFGWKFALGLVLSIYVHEMGHVVALRRFGFKADPPLFIPGLGAFILMKQHPANPHEDAAIGLAGPIYGLGASVAAMVLWLITGRRQPIFLAIATVNAWINLFNLMPIWTLDGGRAFRAFSRAQKWFAAAAVAASYFVIRDGMLLVLLIVVAARALFPAHRTDEPGDRRAAAQYVLLVILLSAICLLRAPLGRP
jgi:Zn-dependent protease